MGTVTLSGGTSLRQVSLPAFEVIDSEPPPAGPGP
jgi:hypothetical protein